jgi:hypothetical protein
MSLTSCAYTQNANVTTTQQVPCEPPAEHARTLANCFNLLLGSRDVVTHTFGSATAADAYSSSMCDCIHHVMPRHATLTAARAGSQQLVYARAETRKQLIQQRQGWYTSQRSTVSPAAPAAVHNTAPACH